MADALAARDQLTELQRGYLDGLWRTHERGRDKMPPPWPAGVSKKPGALAKFVALHPARVSKTAEREEPWLITGVLSSSESGSPVIGRLTVEHYRDPGIEVTGHVLRSLRIADLRQNLVANWLRHQQMFKEELAMGARSTPADKAWARRVTAASRKEPLKRGRQGYPKSHFQRIAFRAVELHREGVRDVTGTIATDEGRPIQTVRDWLHRARTPELGFLQPVKQGQRSFLPGPNLYPKGDT